MKKAKKINPSIKLLVWQLLIVFVVSISAKVAPPVKYYNPQDYFEFTVPIIPAQDEQIDMSIFLDAPAGKDGFVEARDGRFYIGSNQIRFLGTNIAFAGAFPITGGEAKLLARKLAKYGINLVRLHSLDATDGRPSLIDTSEGNTQKLSAQHLDRFDRLVYELKEKGIYVNINLHINRYFKEGDEVAEADLLENFSKGANLFDRRMIELQKKYAKDLLTHVNPYTGNPYTDESAVAAIEITNENSFFYSFYSGRIDSLPPYYLDQLSKLFTEFLSKKYESTEKLQLAWQSRSRVFLGLREDESLELGVKIPLRKENRTNQVWEDYMIFLQKTEEDYFLEMHNYLKNDLGVKAPITGTMAFGLGGLLSQTNLDFIDIHSYMNHPYYPEGDWRGQWFIENTPLVTQLTGQPLQWAAVHRIDNKPFVMSEFNTPYPNWYEAGSLPLFSTFARRQDWDGLYIFDFNASGDYMPYKVTTFFDIDGHPVKMAQLIIASNILVRGDVDVAPEKIVAIAPKDKSLSTMVDLSWNNTHIALTKIGIEEMPSFGRTFSLSFTDQEDATTSLQGYKEAESPIKVWDEKTGRPYLTLDTERTKYGVGFLAGKEIQLNGISFKPFNTQSLYSAVCFTSLDHEPTSITNSKRSLIVVGGRTENTLTIWNKDFTNATFGMEPVRTEGILVEVTLEHEAEEIYVYALDNHSVIKTMLEVTRVQDTSTTDAIAGGKKFNRFSFSLDPKYETIWYLVSIEELY